MASLAELATQVEIGPLMLAPPVAGLIYGVLTWEARSAPPEARDWQIGIKTILGTLVLVGAFHFGRGMRGLVHLLLTFERFGPRLRALAPDLVVGGMVVAGVVAWALPRTNVDQHPRIRRLVAGIVTLVGGVVFVESFVDLVTAASSWSRWYVVAAAAASVLTSAGSALVGGYLLARDSGIEVPPLPKRGGG